MSVSPVYDPVLSRVRIDASGLTVLDSFTRTGSSGWDTSPAGHVWSTSGGAPSDYSTTGTRGRHLLASVGTSRNTFTAADIADVDITVDVVIPQLATGGAIRSGILARRFDDSNYYYAQLDCKTDQVVTVTLFKVVGGSSTTLGTATIPGEVHTTGDVFSMRFHLVGTTLRVKAFGSVVDPGWLIDVTDSALTSGGVGARSNLQTGNTNVSPVVEYDNFLAIPTVQVDRSTDQIRWSTVRGGAGLTPTSGAISLDDYEFSPDVPNFYRALDQTSSITPTLDGVWLKSIARPFLNRQVTVADFSDVERSSRAGVFDVQGRSLPVAVSDVRGSRRWTLDVLTQTLAEASDVDLVLASGDPLFVHVPADSPVPGGYVTVGDTTQRRTGRTSLRRVHSLPCTEVAAPGPDVVGATVNWQTVINTYATWSDVLAAHPTWADMLELIGSPTDVIVP